MHIYFSGIGGVGLGPLAEIALDAGNSVDGSDPLDGLMVDQLKKRGIHIGHDQSGSYLRTIHEEKPVDWLVYTSALPEDHPELVLARQLGIKSSKRDELLAHIIKEKGLKLIAIAGTHGKSGTTGMTVWTMKQLGIPVSYSIGTTMSFGPSGHFDASSEYFVYECDEFDRNFLHFQPYLSLIPSIDYDHPDTYPTEQGYDDAFKQFIEQSDFTILWQTDAVKLGNLQNIWQLGNHDLATVTMPGEHYRRNASLVVKAMEKLDISGDIVSALNHYPGIDRRFEKLADNLYSDYAHHPSEIKAMLQLARELNKDIVVVYQPHQNVRQHEIKDEYTDCFDDARVVYVVPTYLTREDPALPILTPQQIMASVTNKQALQYTGLNEDLWQKIQSARERGALVMVMGAGTIDDWAREKLLASAQ